MEEELFRLVHKVQTTGDLEASVQLLLLLEGRNISLKALHLEYGIPKHLLWDRFKNLRWEQISLGFTQRILLKIINLLDQALPGNQWTIEKESLIDIRDPESGREIDCHYSAMLTSISGVYSFLYVNDPRRGTNNLYEKDYRIPNASLIAAAVSQRLESNG